MNPRENVENTPLSNTSPWLLGSFANQISIIQLDPRDLKSGCLPFPTNVCNHCVTVVVYNAFYQIHGTYCILIILMFFEVNTRRLTDFLHRFRLRSELMLNIPLNLISLLRFSFFILLSFGLNNQTYYLTCVNLSLKFSHYLKNDR